MEIPTANVHDKYKKENSKANYVMVQVDDVQVTDYRLVCFDENHNGGLSGRIEYLQNEYPHAILKPLRIYRAVDDRGAVKLYEAHSDLCKGIRVDLDHILE